MDVDDLAAAHGRYVQSALGAVRCPGGLKAHAAAATLQLSMALFRGLESARCGVACGLAADPPPVSERWTRPRFDRFPAAFVGEQSQL